MILAALLLLVQTTTPPPALAQDEPLTLPAIVYPPQARADHIQGIVHLQIAVDARGQVFGVKALDGPEPLRAAAVEAYSHATYKPLLHDGTPAPAIITTAVNFALAEAPPEPAESLTRRFLAEQTNCQQLSLAQSPQALTACQQAVDTSRHFAPEAELEARATALNDLVLLLIAPGKYAGPKDPRPNPALPQAAEYAQQAVDLVAGTPPHTPAVAIAYITRAEVRSLQGNLQAAEADCEEAEEALATTLQRYPENERAGRYRVQLRETYQLHAVLLDRQPTKAHKAEAADLRQRAATY